MRSTTSAARVLLRALAIVASISSLPATILADSAKIPGLLFATDAEGPWQEPRVQFNGFLADNVNITGNYSIPGPNTSAPGQPISHPLGNSASDIYGWSWTIAVAADIPLENSSRVPHDDGQGPFYYTGERVILNAPSSLVNSGSGNLHVTDDWKLCLVRWELLNVSYPEKLRSDDGTCGSVLSPECISEMKTAVEESIHGTVCMCPRASTIQSCSRLGDDSKLFDTTCDAALFDAQRLRDWKDGKEEAWAVGGNTPHHRGNRTSYNDIGTLAWPLMVSFVGGEYTSTSLTCVRPQQVVGTSEPPTGESSDQPSDQTSGGNSLGGSWARMGAAILVYMLML
ncbi:hypothetical protein F5Y10DRAFT_292986 [Nemania abortiva]|nr:hypothetical protein F5Y10DRAFT_292986 [Nemania abortiva]